MAYRAGAAVADLEFVQFHPTALVGSSLLLSEALRGDGALLLDDHGDRFVEELAPRDVVARAIDARGTAMLDLRPVDRSRFPALMDRLADAGFHPEAEPVPVAPAAHYTMGGIVTDLAAHRRPGLVCGRRVRVYRRSRREPSGVELDARVPRLRSSSRARRPRGAERYRRVTECHEAEPEAPVTPELREALWEHGGLVRDADGLARLVSSPHLLTSLVARSALEREESRGGHFRVDFADESRALDGLHTVLRPGHEPELEPWN